MRTKRRPLGSTERARGFDDVFCGGDQPETVLLFGALTPDDASEEASDEALDDVWLLEFVELLELPDEDDGPRNLVVSIPAKTRTKNVMAMTLVQRANF